MQMRPLPDHRHIQSVKELRGLWTTVQLIPNNFISMWTKAKGKFPFLPFSHNKSYVYSEIKSTFIQCTYISIVLNLYCSLLFLKNVNGYQEIQYTWPHCPHCPAVWETTEHRGFLQTIPCRWLERDRKLMLGIPYPQSHSFLRRKYMNRKILSK